MVVKDTINAGAFELEAQALIDETLLKILYTTGVINRATYLKILKKYYEREDAA